MNKKERIEFNKYIGRIQRRARQEIKLSNCLLCGTAQSSFCNSHSVPRFTISYIAKEGKILTQEVLYNDNAKEKGVNSVWTFQNICRSCDSFFFSEYENEKNLVTEPTTKLLAQIALKSDLMMFNKYLFDKAVHSDNEFNKRIIGVNLKIEEDELNVRDVMWLLKRNKKIIEKNLKSGYILVLYKILDYTVPIAFQSSLVLYKSIDDKTIINDVNDYSEKIIMKPIYLCVFPLQGKTAIYLFHHRDDRNYIPFDRQFAKLSFDDKLQYINYLIFKCTEHCVFSPEIDKSVLKNTNLKRLAKESHDEPSYFSTFNDLNTPHKLVTSEEIPNFLKMKLQ